MHIVVGFKVTPDYESLRAADWARLAAAEGPQGRAEAARYVRRVIGVFDEAALELALRLRDARRQLGLRTDLSACTVGGRESDPVLATLLALGFEAARVDPDGCGQDGDLAENLDFAPAATAALLAAVTRRLGGDVLLLGARGAPGGTGLTPFLASEALERPCLTQVTAIEPCGDDRLAATLDADDGPLRITLAAPCVLAVGNAVVSRLRVPTLSDRLAARGRRVAELDAGELGGAGLTPPASLARLEPLERRRAGVVVGGATPDEAARALYEEHLRARLEQL
jgi:electron transfer flavoprotein alpha/beta subunit